MADRLDDYLDRLFNELAGTGAAGRRALIEAQAHLEEDVERAVAHGVARSEAEAQAIARFGGAQHIAHAHVQAAPLTATLQRVLALGWLMAGVCGAAIGLVGVFNAAFANFVGPHFITEDEPGALYSLAQCRLLGVANGEQALCRAASIAQHAHDLIVWPLIAGAGGLALLALFAWARNQRALRPYTSLPSAAMVSSGGVLAFGGAGLLLLFYSAACVLAGRYDELGLHLAEGLAALCAGAAFAPAAWRTARRSAA